MPGRGLEVLGQAGRERHGNYLLRICFAGSYVAAHSYLSYILHLSIVLTLSLTGYDLLETRGRATARLIVLNPDEAVGGEAESRQGNAVLQRHQACSCTMRSSSCPMIAAQRPH